MMIFSWLLTVHALSRSPFHTVSWSLTRWGDGNNWWKLLMKIIDEHDWSKLLIKIIWWKWLIKMIDQNDSQGIRHLGMSPCASENLTVLELDNCPLITDLRWAMIIFHQSHPCQNIHSQSQNCRLKELLTLAKHACVLTADCWSHISPQPWPPGGLP